MRIYRLDLQRQLSAANSSEVKQVIDQPNLHANIAPNCRQCLTNIGGTSLIPFQKRDGVEDRGQGRAELMGQHRQEAILRLVRCLGFGHGCLCLDASHSLLRFSFEDFVLRFKFRIQGGQSPCLAKQIDEDVHFGAKHQGVNRFSQVVDCSDVIGKDGVLFLKVMRGEKNDRDMLCAPALLNQAGKLNAAKLRHLHIEDYGRKFLTHQGEKCLPAALSLGDGVVSPLENALERKEISWIVIDNEDRRRRRGVCEVRRLRG